MKFKNHVQLIKVVWFAALAITVGCTYFPTEKYVNPISPPANSGDSVSVDISQLGNSVPDTYQMLYYTRFYFKLQGYNQHLESFSVKIDGVEILNGISGNQSQLQFEIDPTTLSSGNHPTEVEMIVDSGTGSLADHLGLEKYSLKKSFTIVVDKVPPNPISSLTLDIENGLLTMKWDKLNKTNFSLTVHRNYWKGNTIVGLPDTVISNTATSYVDPGYVGGNVVYNLFAQGVGFIVNAGASFNLDPFDPTISQNNNLTQVTWAQPLVIGTASSISVVGKSGVKNYYSLTPNTISGDTLFLGGTVTETVTINSGKNALQNYDRTLTLNSHSNIKPFKEIFPMPLPGKFILLSQSGYPYNLFRYSFSNFSVEDSTGYFGTQMAFSKNGQFGLLEGTQINPLKFSQTSSLPTSISNVYAPQFYALSNTGLLTFNYYTNNTGPYYTSVADVTSGQMQFTLSGPQYSNYAYTSDDGNYLWNSELKVYSNSGGSWSLIGTINTNASSPKFRNGSSEVIALASQVLVYDLSSTSGGTILPVRSFTLPAFISSKLNSWGFDQVGQVIYFETIDSNNFSTLWMYDVDTFAYKGKLKAYAALGQNPWSPPVQHFICNGYEFLSSGYCQKIL